MSAEYHHADMHPLTFEALRAANTARLPLFRNPHGQLAHSKPDGSDWSRSDWLEAVLGELGEYANWSKKFRRGDIDEATFLAHASKEFADFITYLDILAMQLGIDLGDAVATKFNEVSQRVGAAVHINAYGDVEVGTIVVDSHPCFNEPGDAGTNQGEPK